MFKRATVVLLPTNKATWPNCIWLGRISKQLHLDKSYSSYISKDPIDNSMLPQHLYITSDEEIKEGDWFVTDDRLRKDENNGISIWILFKCTSIYNGWIEGNNDKDQGYNPN